MFAYFLFVCISLTVDGPQRARLPASPTAATLPSCLACGPYINSTMRIFPSLPGSRLKSFYRDASSGLYNSSTNGITRVYFRQKKKSQSRIYIRPPVFTPDGSKTIKFPQLRRSKFGIRRRLSNSSVYREHNLTRRLIFLVILWLLSF